MPKAVLLSILGTESDIADKYYTHVGDEAQQKAIEAVSGGVGDVSDKEKIRRAIEYLDTLPNCPESRKIREFLTGGANRQS